MNLDFCFYSGDYCEWVLLDLPALCEWRMCRHCGDARYRSLGGWTRVLTRLDAHLPLAEGPLRTLWRRCSGSWSLAYPWAKNFHLYPGMSPDA